VFQNFKKNFVNKINLVKDTYMLCNFSHFTRIVMTSPTMTTIDIKLTYFPSFILFILHTKLGVF